MLALRISNLLRTVDSPSYKSLVVDLLIRDTTLMYVPPHAPSATTGCERVGAVLETKEKET